MRDSKTGRPATTRRVEGLVPSLQAWLPVLSNTVYESCAGTNSWRKRCWERRLFPLGPFPLGPTLADRLKSNRPGFLWLRKGPRPSTALLLSPQLGLCWAPGKGEKASAGVVWGGEQLGTGV